MRTSFLLATLCVAACGDTVVSTADQGGGTPGQDLAIAGGDGGPLGDGGTPADMTQTGACAGVSCGANQHCTEGLCACDPGFAMIGGSCKTSTVEDPANHAQADVCGKLATSGMAAASFFSKTAATCDPGMVTADGITDAVERINYYRWLVGVAPVTSSASANNLAQKCALVSAWNPAGPAAHNPDPDTAQCYTAEGGTGAGSSNIAWGSNDPVDAIDQWIEDTGNATTLGHRRWIFNPPLEPIGFGIYLGGDAGFGSAACMQVFNRTGTGPKPDVVAFPPPGYVDVDMARWTWSFSADGWSFASPTVTVTRLSDMTNLAVTILPLNNPGAGNYPNATSWQPSGWMAQAGQVYRVKVTAGAKTATYDVRPVSCP